MVTIEQKLMLFENLIQHDIFEKYKDSKQKKEEYYEKLYVQNKNEVDKSCEEMQIEEKQKLDRIYLKEEAQIKKTYENSFLKTKEELLDRVLNKIEDKLAVFTTSKDYKKYIDITINKVCTEIDFDKDIILCMTEADIQTYGSYILDNITQSSSKSVESENIGEDSKGINISLHKVKSSIIGGIIIETVDKSMRYDFSLKRNLEESMEVILKSLNAIVEEGDKLWMEKE